MVEVGFRLLGGLGLFLVGMMLLSDGLTSFAGDSLRRALVRFTGTPVKAFVSGALTTLVVQSSAATTVTLIGFVSAGLISFSQATGVVLGASLGTTATGWMIATVGLNISLGLYVLPVIGVGAFLKLLGLGRARALGMAMAGFGMIFVGLDFMQMGMRGISSHFDLAALPVGGLGAHLVVMLIGVLLTVLMQSSTAAVATTLTALHTGTINFEQGAALVVGAAIGTTVTGALAAIGGSVAAKRTALAHIVFNLATGLIAILLLPVYLSIVENLQGYLGDSGSAICLAAFHTTFIAVGVLIFLPQADRFARFIEYLLPERQPAMIRYLDATVLSVPSVALEVTHRALVDIADTLLRVYEAELHGQRRAFHAEKLVATAHALGKVQEFVARIPVTADDHGRLPQRVALIHAIDHLLRFQDRLEEPRLGITAQTGDEGAKALAIARRVGHLARQYLDGLVSRDVRDEEWPVPEAQAGGALGLVADTDEQVADADLRQGAAAEGNAEAVLGRIAQLAQTLTDLKDDVRRAVFQEMAAGRRSTEDSLRMTDSIRWLERTARHVWRFSYYLTEGGFQDPVPKGDHAESGTAPERQSGLDAGTHASAGRASAEA